VPGLATLQDQIAELNEVGFVRVPGVIPHADLEQLNALTQAQLDRRVEPLELEADLQYPGAPSSRSADGGDTVRRLLSAYQRDPVYARWATSPAVRSWMGAYFREAALMSVVHHNCVMTKHPRFGSLTGWHRDIRYWSFERKDLVSVWMALGEESVSNGGLWLVPGSHRMDFPDESFDEAKFFRNELAANAAILQTAQSPTLSPGDALFFHCRTLHSAGQNLSQAVKFSLVFTYHGLSNSPLAATRSSSKPEVSLG
jgi:phytanoyl-CoA hydroxylase